MTILSTHRAHTYKASTVRHRDISPKKIPTQMITPNKKIVAVRSRDMLMALLLNAKSSINSTPILHAPSAPSAAIAFQNIDLYDGVFEEQTEMTSEDDIEEMWNHYDYLEWLYD